jgi:hypothetical protein
MRGTRALRPFHEGSEGLQALTFRSWPPLGAFIKPPALRVVHDFDNAVKDNHRAALMYSRCRGGSIPDVL